MSAAPPEHDLRGLRCPLPALRARRLLRAEGAPAAADFLVDDPRAPADFAALARASGWRLEEPDGAPGAAAAPGGAPQGGAAPDGARRLRLARP